MKWGPLVVMNGAEVGTLAHPDKHYTSHMVVRVVLPRRQPGRRRRRRLLLCIVFSSPPAAPPPVT